MKIILSRKGFDSASGGGPSPIVDGRPVSLPIPAGRASVTSYDDLGLGELVQRASRGKVGRADLCHHDPMFTNAGECLFGQVGAAQTHLANHQVGIGDAFVFFGLFRGQDGERHHRIFGAMAVERMHRVEGLEPAALAELQALGHPHALAAHGHNDVIYRGRGWQATRADHALRLTVPEGPPSLWNVPPWLKACGLSYHDRSDRWLRGGRLRSVARGQEFVCDIGRKGAPRRWLEDILALMD